MATCQVPEDYQSLRARLQPLFDDAKSVKNEDGIFILNFENRPDGLEWLELQTNWKMPGPPLVYKYKNFRYVCYDTSTCFRNL